MCDVKSALPDVISNTEKSKPSEQLNHDASAAQYVSSSQTRSESLKLVLDLLVEAVTRYEKDSGNPGM